MRKELTIRSELDGLEKSKAEQIEAVFAPMVNMLKGFESAYDEIMAEEQSPEKSKKAKRLRLDISKVRIDADKVRKEEKAEFLRAGNAIQGVYNILKFAVTDKEEKLKEVENHYERIEQERIAKLQAERVEALAAFDVDGSMMDLGNMDDIVWSNLLTGSKANYEAKIEAERKAEAERLEAEKAERARVKKIEEENKRLQVERDKAAAELEAKEAAIRKEREKRETAERKIKQEKAEAERKAAAEKAEAEAATRRAEEEAKRQAEREASRSDGEKLAGWADALEKKAGELSSNQGQKAIKEACAALRRGVVVAA